LFSWGRRSDWERRDWDGAALRGRTAVGCTTFRVLKINAALRVMLRQELMAAGLFNPLAE
jgi:hypothetical protein